MSTTDQTFFAAYGHTSSHEERRPRTNTTKTQSGRQGTAPSIDSQYSDGSWYRVDQRHHDHQGVPHPHHDPSTKESDDAVTSTKSEGTTAVIDWSASCIVMASPINTAPVVPAAKPSKAVSFAPPLPHRFAVDRSREVTRDDVARITIPESESLDQPPETKELDVAAAKPAGKAWTAVWEVDEFVWPDELLRLQETQEEYFRYAGEKLRDASREGLKTLAVVATREKEGCTTMAICLARAASAAGARVALVDANLDHPELGPKLGLEFSHGWQEAVAGDGTLADAAVVALDSNLTLLPLSATHRLGSLDEPRVSSLLKELAAEFDLVIVDAGVSPTGDGGMFETGKACPFNAALVVRDLRRTSETETLVTASRLRSLGIDAIGIAENFLPPPGSQIAAA